MLDPLADDCLTEHNLHRWRHNSPSLEYDLTVRLDRLIDLQKSAKKSKRMKKPLPNDYFFLA